MWMIYGANGYTGELTAREAVSRGMRPVLAGRKRDRIEQLARELGLEFRCFDLDRIDLSGISLVLHCAGPFIHTSAPMVDACLAAGAHYLDITGEIAVFESIFRRHEEALARNVVLLPGVGFDVVPTDCLAASLKHELPDASELALAFYTKGGEISRGTLKTMIEGLGERGAVRRNGRIIRVPTVYDVREIPFSCGKRTAMTIPWGDVSTAYRTTGIPNIAVYSGTSPKSIARLQLLSHFEVVAKFAPVKWMLQKFADRRTGPGESVRRTARVHLWGSVRNSAGLEVTQTMTVPEGYHFTVMSSLAAVQRILDGASTAGAWTPAGVFGKDFVRTIDGVALEAPERNSAAKPIA